MRPLMSPILCHRSSLESQKSVAVFDEMGSYRTSSTVSFISFRRFSDRLGWARTVLTFSEAGDSFVKATRLGRRPRV